MRRGGAASPSVWLLVAVPRILSGCQSLREIWKPFALRHHVGAEPGVGSLRLRRPTHLIPPSAICPARLMVGRDPAGSWQGGMPHQIPGGAMGLDPARVRRQDTPGSIVQTNGGGCVQISQVTLYSKTLGVAIAQGPLRQP